MTWQKLPDNKICGIVSPALISMLFIIFTKIGAFWMKCPYCQHSKTNPRAKKTKLGYPTFYCSACCRTFNERTGSQPL